MGEGPTWSLRALSRPQRNHPGLAASPSKAQRGSQGSPNPGHWSRHNPESWLLSRAAPPGPSRHLPEQIQGPPSGSQHFWPAPAPSAPRGSNSSCPSNAGMARWKSGKLRSLGRRFCLGHPWTNKSLPLSQLSYGFTFILILKALIFF